MNTRKLIKEMEDDIKFAEEKGITEIPLKNFKMYLQEVKSFAEEQQELDNLQVQRDLAFYNAKNSNRLEYYKAKINRISDGFHAVITIGQGALKSGALINGGACVALLAFIGNIITKDTYIISGLSKALLMFGIGVFFAAVSAGSTYIAQVNFEIKKKKRAMFFHYITIIIVILSYLSFLGGAIVSYLAIQNRDFSKTTIETKQEKKTNYSEMNINKNPSRP